MTDVLLALIPTYGLGLLALVVALSCLAVPLPASAMVLAAGGFSAAGDLVLWQVIATAFGGFVLGDQTAYRIGRKRGVRIVEGLRRRKRMARPIARAEDMIARRGPQAVFLSRTVLSPLGPYMTYLSGAGGLSWRSYTLAALPGAALWTLAYAGLGYGLADSLAQSTELLWSGLGALAALAFGLGAALWLRRAARAYRAQHVV